MTSGVGSVDLLDVITAGRELPAGYDGWALRTVRPDFRSSNNYRYPYPGAVAAAPGPILEHDSACPRQLGDGICAATSWEGMASGGVPARTLLLVAYKRTDVLGGSFTAGERKARLREFLIVDLIDGERLLIEKGRSANLGSANLGSANLGSANLGSANLRSALNLTQAQVNSAITDAGTRLPPGLVVPGRQVAS